MIAVFGIGTERFGRVLMLSVRGFNYFAWKMSDAEDCNGVDDSDAEGDGYVDQWILMVCARFTSVSQREIKCVSKGVSKTFKENP